MAVTSNPTIGARRRRVRRSKAGYLFLAPAVIFLVAALAYPIFVNVRFSFTNTTAGTLLSGGDWAGFSNYAAVLQDPGFLPAAEQTVVFTAVSILFQLGLGLLLALFYNQRFPASTRLSSLFLLAWSAPVVAIGAVFRWLFDRQFGVFNWILSIFHSGGGAPWLSDPHLAMGAVIFANIWVGTPFYVTFFVAALKNIPDHLYEAASVDGARKGSQLLWITLPLLRAPLLIGAVFGIIFTLKSFDLIWIMTQGGPLGATQTLSTYGYNDFFHLFEYGQGAAVMNILLIGMVIVTVVYLRLSREENA